MPDVINSTLIKYKKQHESRNKSCKVTLYNNFTQCSCGIHAHYYVENCMIEHGKIGESYKIVRVPDEPDIKPEFKVKLSYYFYDEDEKGNDYKEVTANVTASSMICAIMLAIHFEQIKHIEPIEVVQTTAIIISES